MSRTTKRRTSLTLDATVLDEARDLGLNVSAVANAALRRAVAQTRGQQWLKANSSAFTAQAVWHEKNGHPLADIIAGPGQSTWKD